MHRTNGYHPAVSDETLDAIRMPVLARPAGWLALWLIVLVLLMGSIATCQLGEPTIVELIPWVRDLLGR